MSRRVWPLIVGVALFGGILGALSASQDVVDVDVKADEWQVVQMPGASTEYFNAMVQRIMASGILPVSREKLQRQAALAAQNTDVLETGIPKFPEIIGASDIDGIPKVHLRLKGNRIISATSGDVLETGWQLKTVDLERVIAVYEGEEQTFSVTNYKSQNESHAVDETHKKKAN
ncbi:MAG TPA: hypothetical protein ENJ46_05195 [Hellea balneolensis]|uniref:Type IV pilus biogenesis protein PilP n=1 Tax=Hellea balneolensis TaxID=287478 RepID=A0A7C3CC24_9PROT|nr:hypothetical protein [Hellea balneolensis]